jgi:hypothetical protein
LNQPDDLAFGGDRNAFGDLKTLSM